MLACDCKRKLQVGSCSCIDNGLNSRKLAHTKDAKIWQKKIFDIKEYDDLLEHFSDVDDHFDNDAFLNF